MYYTAVIYNIHVYNKNYRSPVYKKLVQCCTTAFELSVQSVLSNANMSLHDILEPKHHANSSSGNTCSSNTPSFSWQVLQNTEHFAEKL